MLQCCCQLICLVWVVGGGNRNFTQFCYSRHAYQTCHIILFLLLTFVSCREGSGRTCRMAAPTHGGRGGRRGGVGAQHAAGGTIRGQSFSPSANSEHQVRAWVDLKYFFPPAAPCSPPPTAHCLPYLNKFHERLGDSGRTYSEAAMDAVITVCFQVCNLQSPSASLLVAGLH